MLHEGLPGDSLAKTWRPLPVASHKEDEKFLNTFKAKRYEFWNIPDAWFYLFTANCLKTTTKKVVFNCYPDYAVLQSR